MQEEIAAIETNDLWELVDIPKEKNLVGLKWMYKTKLHAHESIQKLEARDKCLFKHIFTIVFYVD